MMSRIISKFRLVWSKVFHDPQAYLVFTWNGRKPRLTPAMHRQILFCAETGDYSTNELELPINKELVQPILQAEKSFLYRRPPDGLHVSPSQIKQRIQWAVKHVSTPISIWDRLVWFDDKISNPEGPAESASSWHNLLKDAKAFFKAAYEKKTGYDLGILVSPQSVSYWICLKKSKQFKVYEKVSKQLAIICQQVS